MKVTAAQKLEDKVRNCVDTGVKLLSCILIKVVRLRPSGFLIVYVAGSSKIGDFLHFVAASV